MAEMTRGKLSEEETEMCENAFSEVIGSMGYFYGSSMVQLETDKVCVFGTVTPCRVVMLQCGCASDDWPPVLVLWGTCLLREGPGVG